MISMITIGIDIGVTGALAFLDRNILVDIIDMPTAASGKPAKGKKQKRRIDPHGLADLLRSARNRFGNNAIHVYFESVHAFPGQGVTSQALLGRCLGNVESTLAALGMSFTYISPQVWKRHYGLIDSSKTQQEKKKASLEVARKLTLSSVLAAQEPFRLEKSHNRADAALIGSYGYMIRPSF